VGSGTNYLRVMFCPAYGQFSKLSPSVAMMRVNYMMTVVYSNGPVNVTLPPFGYPNVSSGTPRPVQKLSFVSTCGPVSDVFAVSDVDEQLWPGNWQDVAPTSVHGGVRNRVYFDWHVKSFKGNNLNTVVQ
jgi:hypothetical protein